MTWFKVDDKLHDHRKARKAGPAAMGLWVLAGSWCSCNETDGFVPADLISRWATDAEADRLVEVGFWHADVDCDGEPGFRFHDWNAPGMQPTKAELAQKRSDARDRMARVRQDRKVGSREQDENIARSSRDVRSTRPDPTRPVKNTPPTPPSRDLAVVGPEAQPWVPTASALSAVARISQEFDAVRASGANSWNMLDFVAPMVEQLMGRTDFNGAAGVCLWWFTESTGRVATVGDFRYCARLLKQFGQAGLIAMDEAFKPDVQEPWRYAERVARTRDMEAGA
jgi:hypothetical protein